MKSYEQGVANPSVTVPGTPSSGTVIDSFRISYRNFVDIFGSARKTSYVLKFQILETFIMIKSGWFSKRLLLEAVTLLTLILIINFGVSKYLLLAPLALAAYVWRDTFDAGEFPPKHTHTHTHTHLDVET